MGKNTKFVMERYQQVAEEDFNAILEDTSETDLLLAYNALRQRTEAALVASVAGVLIDKDIDNASYRVHQDPTSGYYEAIVLKKRLDVIDHKIAELRAKFEVADMVSDGEQLQLDLEDENLQALDELISVGGTDD